MTDTTDRTMAEQREKLAEYFEKECNRYANGECMTLHCQKRGYNYQRGAIPCYTLASCEEHEAAVIIRASLEQSRTPPPDQSCDGGEPVAWRWRHPKWEAEYWAYTSIKSSDPDPALIFEPLYAHTPAPVIEGEVVQKFCEALHPASTLIELNGNVELVWPINNVGQHWFKLNLTEAFATLRASPAIGRARYQHVKRGSIYVKIGEAQVQAPADAPLTDYEVVTIYLREGSNPPEYWVRRNSEFNDGRFAALSQPQEKGR